MSHQKVIKVQSRIEPRAMYAIQVDPGGNANQRNVLKGDFLAHSTRRVSCHAPWKGDHDGTLTDHTAENTLDKSRRRDTMFPQSFVLQVYLSDHFWLAISHVISSWGKKQRENLYSVKSDLRHRTKVE